MARTCSHSAARLLCRLHRRGRHALATPPLCVALPESPPAQLLGLASPAVAGGVYSEPRLYDAAFCDFRSFDKEVAFLCDAAAAHAGRRPASFLELCCGPGRHAHAAAALGVATLGVDVSPAMASYAATLFPGASAASFCVGDMRALHRCAPVCEAAPFDVVTCLFSSFTHLVETEDALACLRCVRDALSPRGVFALEFANPVGLFDGSVVNAPRLGGADDWEVPSWDGFTDDGLSLLVQWGAPGDAFDAIDQVLFRTVSISVFEDRAPTPDRLLREVVPTRLFTAQEIRLLAHLAGLRVLSMHGALGKAEEGGGEADARSHDAPRLVILLGRE